MKLRENVKGTFRVLNRTASAGERAYLRTRELTEKDAQDEYAPDQVTEAARTAAEKAIRQMDRRGQKAVEATGENIANARKCWQERKTNPPKEGTGAHSEYAGAGWHGQKNDSPKGRLGGSSPPQKLKRTIKTAAYSGGTQEEPGPTMIRRAQHSFQRTAQTTRRAYQTEEAARRTVLDVQAAAKATARTVKGIFTAAKALLSAVTAACWVAVSLVILICFVGLLASSCFGIFFSSEDTGSPQTMRQVVQEINDEYQAQLDAIQAGTPHDKLEMSGSRAVWPEVLAVYAVRTTTEESLEVATMDDAKKALLKDIFWQMNEISSRKTTRRQTVIVEEDDGNGNIIEKEVTVTQTTLYITVSHKTAVEMAEQLAFGEAQNSQLQQLLNPEYQSVWATVLYGIGASDDQIVSVALSQLGNVGGQPYWSWYGFSERVEWCACFVSWCANECGYIETGIIPKFASCRNGVAWFRERGQWAENDIEPTPGMIIFFDWDDEAGQDGHPNHVGIVKCVEDGKVHTVEGNSSNRCKKRSYPLGDYEILGYGVPAY